MKPIDLTKTLKNYTSGWVSISKDYRRVIASGRTLETLLKKLKEMGNPDGYLMKAAKDYSGYVGVWSLFNWPRQLRFGINLFLNYQ